MLNNVCVTCYNFKDSIDFISIRNPKTIGNAILTSRQSSSSKPARIYII